MAENPCPVIVPSLGGAGEIRTRDPLLAKQMLYQLSYDPRQGLYSDAIKNKSLKIYFVRSIETQKTAGFKAYRFLRPSARIPMKVLLPSP